MFRIPTYHKGVIAAGHRKAADSNRIRDAEARDKKGNVDLIK